MALLFFAQLGIDWQGDRLQSRRLRLGIIAGLVAQRAEARLQMQGDRVVDLSADLPRGQVLARASRISVGTRMMN